MSMNNQGRPTSIDKSAPTDANRRRTVAPGTVAPEELGTISGDRGLDHEEALIFELGHGAVGVDLPDVTVSDDRLGGVPASRLMPHEASARDLLIVAATETNTDEDFAAFEQALKEVLA